MEKKWKYSKRSVVKGVLITACAVFFFMNGQFASQAAGTGKVKVGSAIIRQSADKNSEPVATSSQGTVLTINNEVTDAAGNVWYEIQVDANTIGYVRSDLVEKEGGSDTSTDAAQQTDNAGFAAGAEVGPETPLDAQYATIKVRAAKIRTGASTNKGTVDSLPNGHQVIISGQTNGSDKPWYYITFTGTDGSEKSGYVRSDLITLGDMVPVQAPEEQPQEEPSEEPAAEPEPEVKEDYELIYQPNSEGEYEWYLRDRTGEKTVDWKVSELMDMVNALDVNQSIDAKTISRHRIIIIALVAVIVLLAVVVTILVFKLRDASYEDDEEEEDEEEEGDRRRGREESARRRRDEREEPSEARRRTSDGRQNGTRRPEARRSEDAGRTSEGRRSQSSGRSAEARRSGRGRRTSDGRRQMPDREVRYEEDVDVPVKTGTKRKAKNFMMDDDEFEFEFLNMKDKDER